MEATTVKFYSLKYNRVKTYWVAALFVVGNIVILMFSLIMLVVFASVIGSGSSASVVPKMKGSSVLVINLKDGITDAPITSPFSSSSGCGHFFASSMIEEKSFGFPFCRSAMSRKDFPGIPFRRFRWSTSYLSTISKATR